MFRMLIHFLLFLSTGIAVSIDDCPGYNVSNVVSTSSRLTADINLAGDACNVYSRDAHYLKLLVEMQTDSRLHVKIYDEVLEVYQIPPSFLEMPSGENSTKDSSDLSFSYTSYPFSFSVQRKSTGDTIFNSSGSNLIFESQYVRLRTQLPAGPYIYGLGEDSDRFRRETKNYTRTLWNMGNPGLQSHENLYGSHPFYLEMRNGQAHGVFLWNSNGMDIKIDQDANGQYLEYNIDGGVLDFYFVSGPQPADVSRQYASIIGTPTAQSYWTYGFHQCRYGYQDVMEVAEVVYNYSMAGIPLEAMWTDIDYMDLRRTWTLDPNRFPLEKMQELVTYLHDHQQQYILMVDPPVSLNDSVSWEKAVQLDVLMKNSSGETFVGGMWPGPVGYVDWFHPNSQSFWSGQVASFFDDNTGVGVDGVWIDMNEPANFCAPCSNPYAETAPTPPAVRTSWEPLPGFPADFQPPSSSSMEKRAAQGNSTGLAGRDLENPPYKIQAKYGTLWGWTIWPSAPNYGGYEQYDIHNLYASGMISHTRKALLDRRPNERPFIISRSTFSGDGAKSGHWTGDNDSKWSHYLLSIVQHQEFASLFQIPMVGSDVCGFNQDTHEHLCARWATLGAWYPFYRNHNANNAVAQEFYLWPLVTEAAKKAIRTRFALLDYFYTAFYNQTVDGSPSTIIPLFFQYPNDTNTLDISYQFFYGPSILVSPVTISQDATNVTMYLPEDTFYDYWSGQQIIGNGTNITVTDIGPTDIPVHVRGGSILPLRADTDTVNTTAALRSQNFTLLVAPDISGRATGYLHLDDGKSLDSTSSDMHFSYNNGSLALSGTFGYETDLQIISAKVLGNGSGETFNFTKPLNAPWEVHIR